MKNSSAEEKKKTDDLIRKTHLTKRAIAGCVIAIIILLLIVFIWTINNSDSDRDGGNSITQSSETEILSEELAWTVYGEISKEMLQEEVRKTIVQIRADIVSELEGTDYTINGSGVILEITDEYIDIATAAHVVELTAEPVVYFYDGSLAYGRVLAYGKESDVAFVRVETDGLQGNISESVQEVKYCSVEEYNQTEEGENVFCTGSVVKVADETVYGQIAQKERFVELFQNDMLICNMTVDGGMSGGGVYNTKGQLLGIIVGTGENESACVTITDIMAEYRSFEN